MTQAGTWLQRPVSLRTKCHVVYRLCRCKANARCYFRGGNVFVRRLWLLCRQLLFW